MLLLKIDKIYIADIFGRFFSNVYTAHIEYAIRYSNCRICINNINITLLDVLEELNYLKFNLVTGYDNLSVF